MRLLPLLSLLLLTPTLGCSGEQDPDDPESQRGNLGLLSVTYSHDWAAGDVGEVGLDLSATATFARFSAIDRGQVARLIGLPLDPDHDLPRPGRCAHYDLSLDLAEDGLVDTEAPGNVELLEAGEVKVQTPVGKIALTPRHFPGLVPFISGVIYGEAQSERLHEVGAVRATAAGGEVVGPFQAEVESPALPLLQRTGELRPAAAELARGADLRLAWTPGAGPREALTYLEIRDARGTSEQVLRCTASEDGSFVVAAGDLAGLGAPRAVTVELARLSRAFFSAQGLDRGELRVTSLDRTTVALR